MCILPEFVSWATSTSYSILGHWHYWHCHEVPPMIISAYGMNMEDMNRLWGSLGVGVNYPLKMEAVSTPLPLWGIICPPATHSPFAPGFQCWLTVYDTIDRHATVIYGRKPGVDVIAIILLPRLGLAGGNDHRWWQQWDNFMYGTDSYIHPPAFELVSPQMSQTWPNTLYYSRVEMRTT